MSVENFSELPDEELQQLASMLIQKMNSSSTFVSNNKFVIDDAMADELTGNLLISVYTEDPVSVQRKATWVVDTIDDVDNSEKLEDVDYLNSIYVDTTSAFKTSTATVDGYKVTMHVDDVDDLGIVETAVDRYSEEDAGIGNYEYFGFNGYDSRPYVEVDGVTTNSCTCYITIEIEPLK